MWENHEIISWIKSKNIQLFKTQQWWRQISKGTKKCVTKRKHKLQDYENRLEAAQTERKIDYLRKKKIDVDSSKEDQKDFGKNDKLILKIQERSKSERHNVFTAEIKKTALSSNDDKIIWSIDSIKTYAYGTSRDLICKK